MKRFQAGRLVQQARCKSFQPNPINRAWQLDNMELIQLLGQADRELGRLDMHSEYIPDIDLFVRMHVFKEATQSSRIEGTQTNLDEALRRRADVAAEKRDDWEEVQNYVAAMNMVIDRLQTLPFSSRLIREAHAILMHGVRGQHKMPGEFRRRQNWIGGATSTDAVFVSLVHASIDELMADVESFVHDETAQDRARPLSIRDDSPVSGRQRTDRPADDHAVPGEQKASSSDQCCTCPISSNETARFTTTT